MTLTNGPDHFGAVTRALHWIMAALILAQLGLGLAIAQMQVTLSNLWLFSFHKSLGMTVLALAIMRLAWHRVSPPPRPLTDRLTRWQAWLARVSHPLLYALMVAMPLTGWWASSAAGPDVVVFGGLVLPKIAPTSPALEDFGFALHGVLAALLFGLIALHVAGALYHQFVLRDRTLARMASGAPDRGEKGRKTA